MTASFWTTYVLRLHMREKAVERQSLRTGIWLLVLAIMRFVQELKLSNNKHLGIRVLRFKSKAVILISISNFFLFGKL